MHKLLDEARIAYCRQKALVDFAPFPDDLVRQPFTSNVRESATLLRRDHALVSTRFPQLQKAIIDSSEAVHWRETYEGSSHETEFMKRWGCFSIIGDRAPFLSKVLRLFVVYMPADLVYPWHRHPAEEMYLVLSGHATFERKGHAAETLSEGQHMFHASNQPHALVTTNDPVLCLVAWRTHLSTRPELVPQGDHQTNEKNRAPKDAVLCQD